MRSIALALACGLLLRLFFLFRFAHVAGDSLLYGAIAGNLLRHGVYGFATYAGTTLVRPTLIRLPGYPLFLALCFRVFGVDRYTPVLLLQIFIDLVTCGLVARLAARLFGTRAGLAALWLGALCPFTSNYTVAPLTETLTLFCIALAFFTLEQWQVTLRLTRSVYTPWFFALAATLAYAILLRPEQGLLAAAIVPAFFFFAWRSTPPLRAISTTLLLCLLTVLPLAPWAARNWHTFHVFEPLAPRFANDPGERNPDGFQRWYRTWAIDFASTDLTYWNYDGSDILLGELPARAFDNPTQYAATAALLNIYNLKDTPTPALDVGFNSLALARIRTHPTRYYLLLPIARVLNMAFRPRTDMLPVPDRWWQAQGHLGTFIFSFCYAALNFVYLALAAFTLLRRRKLWRPHAILIYAMLATIIFRSALLLTLDNSEPRYTLEFYPILILLGAVAFTARKAFPQTRTPSGSAFSSY